MSAACLFADLIRRGIELQRDGDAIRYRPREAMTPDLLEQVKMHKPDLLAILATISPEAATAMRDDWAERVAICEIDGGLSPEQAEAVAVNDLNLLLDETTSKT